MAGKTLIYRPHDGCQRAMVRSNVDVVFAGGNLGAGKGHPLHERILTPNGWVKCGDLAVGDMVCTPFGEPSRILGIFDHKGLAIYRVTMNDGRSMFCDENHLWSIRTPKQLYKYFHRHDNSRNLTTISMFELIDRWKSGKKTYIPIPDAQGFDSKDYVIPPYTMGVLLGDGCLTEKSWTRPTFFVISNTEEDIVERLSRENVCERHKRNGSSPTVYFYTNKAKEYMEYCKEVGIATYSYNKFIPKEYLFGSIEQRKQLLFGLMDTDGSIDEKGRMSFSTTSERLALDFVDLCRSLGMVARVSKDNRAEKYTNGVAYNVNISTKECIVSSEKHLRKYNAWINCESAFKREYKHVYVTSIEYIDHEDSRCISIEDRLHLYVAGDYVTTHNTFGAAMATAEPSLDPRWRGLVVKNNIDDLKRGGGVIDTFSAELYGSEASLRNSEMPRLTFPNGAWIDFCHLADQSYKAIMRRFKSSQYDWIYFDELTEFSWDAFRALLTRNRGKSAYAGKCLATTNPERESWIRVFIDWYIDDEGYIIPERDGVVRYFFIKGKTVNEVVWGDTKEEVYRQCRFEIDDLMRSQKTDRWDVFIKSFTFYEGRMSDNKEMLEANPNYVGTIAMMGETERKKLLGGCWNVSSSDDDDAVVTYDEAASVFTNDEQRNGDGWITVDLADYGTNNFLQIAWDGFHVKDIDIVPFSTPRGNAERCMLFAAKHGIAHSHIIFDATSGMYFKDYIPEAIPYVSGYAPMGLNALQYTRLKDCCYGKFVFMLKHNLISFSSDVANSTYVNAASKTVSTSTVQDEFCEEVRTIRWVDAQNGKKRLMTKKEMKKMLGRGRSPDLVDPMTMRMYPVLGVQDGYELENGRVEAARYEEQKSSGDTVDIYDDTAFGFSYGGL